MGAFLRLQRIWSSAFAVLSVFVILCPSTAQITFERTYGGIRSDRGYSVRQTEDGGYIVAGATSSFGIGPCDLYLLKTDSLGDTVWTAIHSRPDTTYDWGYSVQQTSEGGYIVLGSTDSQSGDLYLVKTDSLGAAVWTTTYGGPFTDGGTSVLQALDGGYVVAGRRERYADSGDVYLIRTDYLGDTVWTRTYNRGPDAGAFCVEQTLDAGYIVVGYAWSSSADSDDVFLLKTDTLGDTAWARTYGGAGSERGYSVAPTLDGGYLIAGGTSSYGAGKTDVYLIKTDSVGDTVWTKTYGGSDDDHAFCVQQTLDGGCIVAGETWYTGEGWDDLWLIKTDSAGIATWMRTYGGSYWDWGYSVQQVLDGGYIIAGGSSSFGAGSDDVYLIKTDDDGLTGVEEARTKPEVSRRSFGLLQNSPNPFYRSTQISYSLPQTAQVTLTIYDITGRLVETLVNETQQPGMHQVRWDRKGNPSGVYFCRLSAGEFVQTRKTVVVE